MSTPRRQMRSLFVTVMMRLWMVVLISMVASCSKPVEPTSPAADKDRLDVPDPDTSEMEPQVAQLIRASRQAVVQNPGSADAWWRLAAACDVHKLYAPAVKAYRRASVLAPDDFRIIYNLATAFEEQATDSDEAVELFQKASRLRPDYPIVHMRLGDTLSKRGRLAQSRDAYLRAVELDPNLARAHRSLGQVLLSLNDVDNALTHLERAAALGPNDGPTMAALAQAYARLGDTQKAKDAAQRYRGLDDVLLINDPVRQQVADMGVSSYIWRKRANRFLAAGDYHSAVRELTTFAAIHRDDPWAHYWLGYAAARAGRLDLAQRQLFESIRLDAAFDAAHLELAMVFMAQGRFDPAIQQLRRALEIAPDNAQAHWQLAAALAQAGRSEEALLEFARVAAVSPPDASGQVNWGATLMQEGEVSAALEHFREATVIQPDLAIAQYNLGLALEELGRVAQAIVHYRRAVEIDPNHVAKQRLAELESKRLP